MIILVSPLELAISEIGEKIELYRDNSCRLVTPTRPEPKIAVSRFVAITLSSLLVYCTLFYHVSLLSSL